MMVASVRTPGGVVLVVVIRSIGLSSLVVIDSYPARWSTCRIRIANLWLRVLQITTFTIAFVTTQNQSSNSHPLTTTDDLLTTVVALEAVDAAAAVVAMSVTVAAPVAHIMEMVAPRIAHHEMVAPRLAHHPNCVQSRLVRRTCALSEYLSRAAESWPKA